MTPGSFLQRHLQDKPVSAGPACSGCGCDDLCSLKGALRGPYEHLHTDKKRFRQHSVCVFYTDSNGNQQHSSRSI